MKKAYAASNSLIAMFEVKNIDFSIFLAIDENIKTWAIEKNIYVS